MGRGGSRLRVEGWGYGLLGVGSGEWEGWDTRDEEARSFSGNSTRGKIETASFGGGLKLEVSSPGVGSFKCEREILRRKKLEFSIREVEQLAQRTIMKATYGTKSSDSPPRTWKTSPPPPTLAHPHPPLPPIHPLTSPPQPTTSSPPPPPDSQNSHPTSSPPSSPPPPTTPTTPSGPPAPTPSAPPRGSAQATIHPSGTPLGGASGTRTPRRSCASRS